MAGQLIRQARHDARLSQVALGERIGVKQQTVAKWESGENRPTVDNVVAMADCLPTLDPLGVVHALWPEIASADPVPPELRDLLARATRSQVKQVTLYARQLVDGEASRPGGRVIPIRESELPAAAATGRAKPKGRRVTRPQPPIEEDPET